MSRVFTKEENGSVYVRLVTTPQTPDEIVEYLRTEACVDERGMRRLPNWIDDEVFEAAADLIDKLRGKGGAA